MAEARPRVWVSQPLFDDIVGRLDAYFEVDATREVTAWSPESIADKLRGAAGAVVTLNECVGAR
ncbi:MAG TPA: D-glycerate dehydrogenase, partial [Luteimonas sp.]|nr:D-glycerate dehydrogenase [Luteimonas sp.]